MSSTPLGSVARPRSSSRSAAWSFIVLFAALFGGCASVSPRITVNSWGKVGTKGTSYALRDVSPRVREDSPALREATAELKKALAERGLREAGTDTVADLIVVLDWGVRPRPVSPNWANSTAQLPAGWNLPQDLEIPNNFGNWRNSDGSPLFDSSERTPHSLPPNLIPPNLSPAVSGWKAQRTDDETYLRITAWENPAMKPRLSVPRWSVSARSDVKAKHASQDPGDWLPALVATALSYLGTNSGGPRWVDLDAARPEPRVTGKNTHRSESAVRVF